MVFTIDDEQNKMMAKIQNMNRTETYTCEISSCKNPVCGCSVAYLTLVPVYSDVDSLETMQSHDVTIDLYKKKLGYQNDKKVPKDELKFAKLFLQQLDENDYQILNPLFFRLKNKICEEAPVDLIDVPFDFEDIEYDSAMWAYNDILPYGNQLYVKINDKSFIIYDQYCLQPKCTCTDVFLNLFPIDIKGTKGIEYCIVNMDYKKKRWEMTEDSPRINVAGVKSAIETQIPDLYSQLGKRHKKLKAIYAHNRAKNYQAANDIQAPMPKVGRNDPCPCGSGKKYKKCCMP